MDLFNLNNEKSIRTTKFAYYNVSLYTHSLDYVFSNSVQFYSLFGAVSWTLVRGLTVETTPPESDVKMSWSDKISLSLLNVPL